MLRLEGKRVYLACGSHDMRKSINGLAVIVESSFSLDPYYYIVTYSFLKLLS